MTTTDHHIGLVLDRLEKLDQRDNTIIFMSDNGHSEEKGLTIRRDGHSSG